MVRDKKRNKKPSFPEKRFIHPPFSRTQMGRQGGQKTLVDYCFQQEKKKEILKHVAYALEVTCDDFPYDLYYVRLYERMKQVRTVVRKCLADHIQDDEYRHALLEIEGILAESVKDKKD